MTHHQRIDRQGYESMQRGWIAEPMTLTVKIVCAPCNNDWMSQVESDARPYLETMLRGHSRELDEGGQQALATWAIKTAMMFEHTQPAGGRVFPQELYGYLYKHRQPPAELRVWITTYTGNWPAFAHVYGLDTEADEKDPSRNSRDVYGATVALGPAALQVFGTMLSDLAEGINSLAPGIVHQIWPYRSSCIWTPRPAFDDDQLVRFADGIAVGIVRNTSYVPTDDAKSSSLST